ncbi:hypothetical protein Fmac_025340 [Flemingia macrophylla]|uniref:DUF7745 domain-containing protein n=1 Tax=Flemingia macrophylla TaxID=520843 RepID=A0ABD1LRY5_9FABA
MGFDLRKALKLKVKQPELKSLKDLSNKLKNAQRISFAHRYGKILDLQKLEVQVRALTMLALFYDTLEEFYLPRYSTSSNT